MLVWYVPVLERQGGGGSAVCSADRRYTRSREGVSRDARSLAVGQVRTSLNEVSDRVCVQAVMCSWQLVVYTGCILAGAVQPQEEDVCMYCSKIYML